ncbi:MAG: hypothetical protein OEY52_12170 [Gammaproteobacteria bacterium]|nr:hypothetical protein [Gammaproteobacteria bacterium]
MKNVLLMCLFVIGFLVTPMSMAMPPVPKDHPAMPEQKQNLVYGKVVTSMDANNYTYVQIDTGSKKYWAAGPKTKLAKGSMIAINANMPFKNFESKALNKKFETIYFVGNFISDKPEKNKKMTDPHAGIKMPDSQIKLKGIKKLKDGKTVEQVFSEKQNLSGKAVRVRGKVVKYTAKVMGRNWLHIQDSSGSRKLVVTSDQEAKIGDLVVINGTVAINQDLGHGYTYEVIVERAALSKE